MVKKKLRTGNRSPGPYADDLACFTTCKPCTIRATVHPSIRAPCRQFKKKNIRNMRVMQTCKFFSFSFRKIVGRPLIFWKKKHQHWLPGGTLHYPTAEVWHFTSVEFEGPKLHPHHSQRQHFLGDQGEENYVLDCYTLLKCTIAKNHWEKWKQ